MPAYTSPDNIQYPVSTDQVAPLETVFANLADSTQDALTTIPPLIDSKIAAIGSWSGFTPAVTGLSIGNGSIEASYMRIGRTAFARYLVTFGSTTSFTGTFTLGVPVNFPASGRSPVLVSGSMLDASAGAYYSMDAIFNTGSTIALRVVNSAGTYATLVPPSGSVPFTWAATDQIAIALQYQTA